MEKLARLESYPPNQLGIWERTVETHEQVAVGQETTRSDTRIERWLEYIERRIEGGKGGKAGD